MKTIRFRTRISKSGTIDLPKYYSLNDREVEVIIMPKEEEVLRTNTAKEFVDKWAGFLDRIKGSSDPKFNYLMEKHK